MARKGGGRHGQPPMKGFRPGKAPAQLKKQRAKAQLGSEANWAQKQTIDAIAGKTPKQVEALVRKWSIGFGAAAAALAVLGVFVYGWSVVAGVFVHVLAAVLLFLAWRIRKQGPGLAQIADSLR